MSAATYLAIRQSKRRASRGSVYDPVVPAYHAWKEWMDPPPHSTMPRRPSPDACGTCGLAPDLHEGWEDRRAREERFHGYDRWDLLNVIAEMEAVR